METQKDQSVCLYANVTVQHLTVDGLAVPKCESLPTAHNIATTVTATPAAAARYVCKPKPPGITDSRGFDFQNNF